jgi:hypothetical protein
MRLVSAAAMGMVSSKEFTIVGACIGLLLSIEAFQRGNTMLTGVALQPPEVAPTEDNTGKF